MAKPGSVQVNPSGNQDIDGILWGDKWDTTTLTFSYPTSKDAWAGYHEIDGFQPVTDQQAAAINQILHDISGFSNLKFQITDDNDAALRFGRATGVDFQGDGVMTIDTAHGNAPDPDSYPSYAQGDVWINANGFNSPQLGNFDYDTLMHEIGHTLGLKHGHVTQDGHGVTFPELPSDHDSSEYSVMTYWQYVGDTDPISTQPDLPQSYMQDDIAAIQFLYGANFNYNSGDTVYSFDKLTGAMIVNGVEEETPSANFIFRTIWDGGGNDTYDFSNYTTNLRVDLNPGAWTNLGTQLADLGDSHFARGNIANALLFQGNNASLIENAIGGSGNDTLVGNDAVNRLVGNDGNDILDGRRGGDIMIGGKGDDTYYVDSIGHFFHQVDGTVIFVPGDTVIENPNEGHDVVLATVDYTLPANVEGLTMIGTGPQNGTGNALDNIMWGNDSDNVIDGGLGADYMYGGGGNDTFIVDNPGDAILEDWRPGIDTVKTTLASYTLGSNLENLTYIGSGNFTGTGNGLANVITGGNGNDWLDGGAGIDTLIGGAGNDTYVVDNPGDVIIDSAGVDTVLSKVSSYTLAAGVENLTYIGTGNFNGVGNSLNNTLRGGSGDDVLNGGLGNDTMIGGAGNDTYYVNSASDVAVEAHGAGTDTVISSVSYTLGAEVENLTLTGAPTQLVKLNGTGNSLDNLIVGSAGANNLFGNGGSDTLIGGEGSDRLDGGPGADILTGDFKAQAQSPGQLQLPSPTQPADGSAYNDVFVFHLGEANGDVVTDFYGAGKTVGDQLEFHGYGAGTIAQVGNSDFYSITPDAAHGGPAMAETIELQGVFNLNTHAGSNDFLFV